MTGVQTCALPISGTVADQGTRDHTYRIVILFQIMQCTSLGQQSLAVAGTDASAAVQASVIIDDDAVIDHAQRGSRTCFNTFHTLDALIQCICHDRPLTHCGNLP